MARWSQWMSPECDFETHKMLLPFLKSAMTPDGHSDYSFQNKIDVLLLRNTFWLTSAMGELLEAGHLESGKDI